MQTHGYEHAHAWRSALALVDHIQSLADTFADDPFGMAGKLRSLAADLPLCAAQTFEQHDYDSAKRQATHASAQLFNLRVQSQLAQHLGLLTPRQRNNLQKKIDALDDAITDLPDELFEDDGEDAFAGAA